jgi:Bardet-Biedl syndrome 5 protein
LLERALRSELQCGPGEYIIDKINSVEDTKGNNGTRGVLEITNLRVIWYSHRSFRVNLSVGYSCIQTITIRSAPSLLRQKAQALYLMTKHDGMRYEFIFTSLVQGSPRLFTTIQAVFRAYETSKLYRDLKLRGAIVKDSKLKTLPDEEVFNRLDGVMNLSSDQGNLGVLYLTNVRAVSAWGRRERGGSDGLFAGVARVSGGELQCVDSVDPAAERSHAREPVRGRSRGGDGPQVRGIHPRLQVGSPRPVSDGPYVLLCAVDEWWCSRDAAVKEMQALWQVYRKDPLLGVKHVVEDAPGSVEVRTVERRSDDVEIEDTAETSDTMAAYMADAAKIADREPVLDPDLGLAVESMPSGYDASKLWASV